MKHPLHRWLGNAAFTNARKTWEQLAEIATHFSLAGLGIRMRLIPNPLADERVPLMLFGLAATLLYLVPDPLFRAGVLWIALAPVWFYAAAAIPHVALENRFYIALPGLAMLSAWAWERGAYVGVILLLVAWMLRTLERAKRYESEVEFWRVASREEPHLFLPSFNFASHLFRHITDKKNVMTPEVRLQKLEWVLAIYRQLLHDHENHIHNTPAAAANLASALLVKAGLTGEIVWQNVAFELVDDMIERFPYSVALRLVRANLVAQLGTAKEAIDEYSNVLLLDQKNVAALRLRAHLHASIGQNAEAIADFQAAEKVDGLRANIRWEKRPVEELCQSL